MIPKHEQFLEAIKNKKKVSVRFYSKPDSGVLERICAPMRYGPGSESHDELNRYWLWDYTDDPGSHLLGLVPQQIADLQVLGQAFDPAEFAKAPPPVSAAPRKALPASTVA